jgi:hypothetical protein
MSILLDTHVHFYPEYDLPALLEGALRRLRSLSPYSSLGIFVTDREGQNFRHLLRNLSNVREEEEDSFLYSYGTDSLRILPGSQIISTEGLEVLALGPAIIPSREFPLSRILSLIDEAGALPVLPWSFGKWWFRRGKVLRAALEHTASSACLGDISLRAYGTAPLNGLAKKVLAGSDPLPMGGEEREVGRYATRIPGEIDPHHPVTSVLAALRAASTVELAGTRNSFLRASLRYGRFRVVQRLRR